MPVPGFRSSLRRASAENSQVLFAIRQSEEGGAALGGLVGGLGAEKEFERAGTDLDRGAKDDALRHAHDAVGPAVDGSVEEVVHCLLETRKHEDALLHLRQPEPRDAQHLALESHDLGEESRVPLVHCDAVLGKDVADFAHDGTPGRLDAQYSLHLHDVVGATLGTLHARGGHDLLQPSALDEKLVPIRLSRLLLQGLDNGPSDRSDTAYDHIS
mmetsp:Transcript_61091/g.144157  ORF Transcript_61091/g.144157 Transcript_61091/m.144157 type:complete len:214 (+) Transcript_61091:103-744(+)